MAPVLGSAVTPAWTAFVPNFIFLQFENVLAKIAELGGHFIPPKYYSDTLFCFLLASTCKTARAMKRSSLTSFLLILLCFIGSRVLAQVGIGTVTPNAKAVLELKSPNN